MPNQEKYENKEKDEFFEQLKKVEITPLPYFSSELLALPEDVLKELRKTADRHNCTVSYVIEHFLEDFLSDVKDISEISQESLLQISKDKSYLFIKKDGKPFARVSFFCENDKDSKDYTLKKRD